jgi:hypothetical protein
MSTVLEQYNDYVLLQPKMHEEGESLFACFLISLEESAGAVCALPVVTTHL